MGKRLRGLRPALSGEQGPGRGRSGLPGRCASAYGTPLFLPEPASRQATGALAQNRGRLLRHFGRPDMGTAGPRRAPLPAALPAPGPRTHSPRHSCGHVHTHTHAHNHTRLCPSGTLVTSEGSSRGGWHPGPDPPPPTGPGAARMPRPAGASGCGGKRQGGWDNTGTVPLRGSTNTLEPAPNLCTSREEGVWVRRQTGGKNNKRSFIKILSQITDKTAK